MTPASLPLLAALAFSQAPGDRVILAANANVRSAPRSDAATVCQIAQVGDELDVARRIDGWLQVSWCGREAFISASLARSITDTTRSRVREEILRDRVSRTGQSFAAADHLIRLSEAWGYQDGGRDRETRGRYALYRLQALRAAAELRDVPAFRSNLLLRLGEQSPVFFYNEIGGGWMIRNAYILTVHEEFRDTRAADDIAWFAVENGLGGECEGYVPCYVSRFDQLFGEYLRRHPSGRHVPKALEELATLLDVVGTDMLQTAVSRADSCKDLKQPLTGLDAAVRAATGDLKPVLSRLSALEGACR